jgi:hypothetical protein
MIQFQKPVNLNGDELLDELAAVGIVLDKNKQCPTIDADGIMWLDINESDKTKAEAVVAAHNGNTISPESTIADKLASVGLSLDELKAAILGGN